MLALTQKQGLPLEKFVIHNTRRTTSTISHEEAHNSDWIEKALPYDQRCI